MMFASSTKSDNVRNVLVDVPRPVVSGQRLVRAHSSREQDKTSHLYVNRSLRHIAIEVQVLRQTRCSATSDENHAESKSEAPPLAAPLVTEGADWRDFRAQLVARNRGAATAATSGGSWAHVIPQPELGCVLVANPLMFTNSQTYFDQSIILIFEKTAQYTAGIIINKPTSVRLGEFEGSSPLLPMFAESRLHLGGDVGSDTMQMMHSRAVPGSHEIRAGVHMGGTAAVKDLISRGEMHASEVKWFTRYSGWGPNQLENECKRNVWFPASVSADLILKHLDDDGRSLWHEVMELLGEDYKNVSEQVKSTRNAQSGHNRLKEDKPSTWKGDTPR